MDSQMVMSEKAKQRSPIKKRMRRLSKQGEKALTDLSLLYDKPIDEWTWEELQRGRPANENGKFFGPDPKWITPTVREEAARRLRSMGIQKVGEHTGAAIKVMADLMQNGKVEIVRFQAAKYILDQVLGMPIAKMELAGSVEIRSFLADVIVGLDGKRSDHAELEDIVDADVVDEDPGDDEDEEDY